MILYRIDLIMAYEAEEAKVPPHVNGNGQLVEFKADGQVAEPCGAWQSLRPKTGHPFGPGTLQVSWGLGLVPCWQAQVPSVPQSLGWLVEIEVKMRYNRGHNRRGV